MSPLTRCASNIITLTALTLTAPALSEITLPDIIADHMVVQRDVPVRIWGTADPGRTVTASFAGQSIPATADAQGHWLITFKPMPASALPRNLILDDGGETRTIHDVLVGEVWLCSGQSNMAWPLRATDDAEQYTSAATNSTIRMFIIPNAANPEPQENATGAWYVSSPRTVGQFSAVAYHFGLQLARNLDVPIGLVNSSWGGSAVEAWVSRAALEPIDAARPILLKYDQALAGQSRQLRAFAAPDFDDSTWKGMALPSLVEDHGLNIDGIIWFRREFAIPHEWVGLDLTINLGPIDDNDQTFVNGVLIGQTNNWTQPRTYTFSPAPMKTPSIAVAIRVEDTGGAGGFSGTLEQMSVHPVNEPAVAISLAGNWRYHVAPSKPLPPPNHRSANLYNAMIHPIRHFTIRGAIWYQGESNAIAPRGGEYFPIFSALIHDWRHQFQNPDFPFLFVQLPNFASDEPGTRWRYPVVRQAQLDTLRTVPHTGMAITLDIGNPTNIHPRNKFDVGLRLAHWALYDTYGQTDLVKSGPIPNEADFLSDGRVVVRFDCFGSSLKTRNGSGNVTSLEIAGPDGEYQAALGTIDGDGRLVIRATGVDAPAAVRYAWKNNPTDANLVNAVGWPASPFEFRRR